MEIKIGELYISKYKHNHTYTIDKIKHLTNTHYISSYTAIDEDDNLPFYNNHFTNQISNFDFIPLDEYLQNPEKYPQFNYDKISKMWKKFMENDIVEARKYKLKLLENYGN